jgi:hypothetical protein
MRPHPRLAVRARWIESNHFNSKPPSADSYASEEYLNGFLNQLTNQAAVV